jgi:hypothetical protein
VRENELRWVTVAKQDIFASMSAASSFARPDVAISALSLGRELPHRIVQYLRAATISFGSFIIFTRFI